MFNTNVLIFQIFLVGAGEIAQRQSACLQCARPWVQCPGLPKIKNKKIFSVRVASIYGCRRAKTQGLLSVYSAVSSQTALLQACGPASTPDPIRKVSHVLVGHCQAPWPPCSAYLFLTHSTSTITSCYYLLCGFHICLFSRPTGLLVWFNLASISLDPEQPLNSLPLPANTLLIHFLNCRHSGIAENS